MFAVLYNSEIHRPQHSTCSCLVSNLRRKEGSILIYEITKKTTEKENGGCLSSYVDSSSLYEESLIIMQT
jgi:hypothetical protein